MNGPEKLVLFLVCTLILLIVILNVTAYMRPKCLHTTVLQWKPSAGMGVVGYNIYRRCNLTTVQVGSTDTTSFTDYADPGHCAYKVSSINLDNVEGFPTDEIVPDDPHLCYSPYHN